MTSTTFSDQVTQLLREMMDKRNSIKEEFTKAYLVGVIPPDVPFEEFIQKLELVEEWSKDRMTVSWYFRQKTE